LTTDTKLPDNYEEKMKNGITFVYIGMGYGVRGEINRHQDVAV